MAHVLQRHEVASADLDGAVSSAKDGRAAATRANTDYSICIAIGVASSVCLAYLSAVAPLGSATSRDMRPLS